MYLLNKDKYMLLSNKSVLLLVLFLTAIKPATYFIIQKSPNMSSTENAVYVNDHITVTKVPKFQLYRK